MRSCSQNHFLLFLVGLGTATKLYLGGIIAISELFAFALAPYFFIRNYRLLKKDGFLPLLWMSLLMIVGCYISCQYNHVHIFWFIKSAMQFYSIFAMVVVFYVVLKKGLSGLGWFFIGLFVSTIISIFVLNPQVRADATSTELIGQIDIETQMEGVLFWYPKIAQFLKLPIEGWYFSTPYLYSSFAPLLIAIISALLSTSGRGAAALAILSSLLICFCGRSRKRMRFLGKHFFIFMLSGLLAVVMIKNLYAFTAKRGLLGYEAQAKYFVQTKGDNSLLRLLIGGRTEFFIAIRAMIDHPIVGVGPRAEDTKGYTQEFLVKYGTHEDYERYIRIRAIEWDRVERIPQHSIFTQFWGNAGIFGLAFCLYFLYLVYLYFRKYAHCIPQLFGYFALSIPPALFSFFFNPYSERVTFPLLMTCLLISRAVGKRTWVLPLDMEIAADTHC